MTHVIKKTSGITAVQFLLSNISEIIDFVTLERFFSIYKAGGLIYLKLDSEGVLGVVNQTDWLVKENNIITVYPNALFRETFTEIQA